MAKIYYCKNEDDMKRVAIYLFCNGISCAGVEDAIMDSGIYSCNYKSEEIECCRDCELDECLLTNHINDKNVYKHIELSNDEIEYPCIVCVADTRCHNERITICSVSDAKENTRYGFNGGLK